MPKDRTLSEQPGTLTSTGTGVASAVKARSTKNKKFVKLELEDSEPAVSVPSKTWWEAWQENQHLRSLYYDQDMTPYQRISEATAIFNKNRTWPLPQTQVRNRWDQFQVFAGLLDNAAGDDFLRLAALVEDPAHSVQVYLSSHFMDKGLHFSKYNCNMIPKLLWFYVNFLLVNNVLPDQNDSLYRALNITELAQIELPLFSQIGEACPDHFNEACKQVLGVRPAIEPLVLKTEAATETGMEMVPDVGATQIIAPETGSNTMSNVAETGMEIDSNTERKPTGIGKKKKKRKSGVQKKEKKKKNKQREAQMEDPVLGLTLISQSPSDALGGESSVLVSLDDVAAESTNIMDSSQALVFWTASALQYAEFPPEPAASTSASTTELASWSGTTTEGWGEGSSSWGNDNSTDVGGSSAWGWGTSDNFAPDDSHDEHAPRFETPPPPTSFIPAIIASSLPKTHVSGIVEHSVRRVHAIFPPLAMDQERAVGGSELVKVGGDVEAEVLDALALEGVLEATYWRVVLGPWAPATALADMDPDTEAATSVKASIDPPRILSTSNGNVALVSLGTQEKINTIVEEGAVCNLDAAPGHVKPHNPLQDKITIFVEETARNTLRVGMGLGGTWTQMLRRSDMGQEGVQEGTNSATGHNALSETRYWYMHELLRIVPSYYCV